MRQGIGSSVFLAWFVDDVKSITKQFGQCGSSDPLVKEEAKAPLVGEYCEFPAQ